MKNLEKYRKKKKKEITQHASYYGVAPLSIISGELTMM